MANDQNDFIEEIIDSDRIFTDERHIINEFSCPICQNLLWKPKSCASCQNLFCNQCIVTWLTYNPTSCPFRCQPYEEKRPPPYVHSLLSRLSIRCRNSSFGCTQVISYNLLEQHQTLECQFPTKKCNVCKNLILVNEIDEHQRFCISPTINCFVCHRLIDRTIHNEHLIKCFQERLDLFMENITPVTDDVVTPNENNMLNFLQDDDNQGWRNQFNNRLGQFISRMPRVDLVGLEEVLQARQLNCFNRVYAMLRLILLNRSRAIQITFFLFCCGIGGMIGCLVYFSLCIQRRVSIAMHRSFTLIILLSGLIGFGIPFLFTMMSDIGIILIVFVSSISLGSICTEALPLECIQINHRQKYILILYVLAFLTLKFSLIITRLWFSIIPSYIFAGCLAWISIFVTFHIRRF